MKPRIPYPLLLITAVILDRVAISSTQIDAVQSLRPLFVLLLLTAIVTLIIHYFIKDWHYANFIVLMIPALLLAYRSLSSLIKTQFPQQADVLALALIPIAGVLYALVVSRRLWRSIRNPARVTYYFSLVFGLLLSFQAVRIAKEVYALFVTETFPSGTAISALTDDTRLQDKTRPDIYVIVLDGYARQDVLHKIYNHDNTGFISELETRGFYVASKSHSNYIQTVFTMASFWNYDYLKPWQSAHEYPQYLLQPIQKNRAFHLLDEIGYTSVSFEGVSSFTQIKDANVYLSNFLPFNKFETLLLVDSPLEPLSNMFDLGIPIPTYKTHRLRVRYELDTLKEIPASISGPKIVYAHIVSPHPPFVFDRNGNAIQSQKPYSLWDESTYHGGQAEYWNGYRNQLVFVNTEIIKTIDAILEKSETPPIIVLMGDHGPASTFDWDLEAPRCVWERTSNLFAVLLPGHQTDGTLYASMSPVNTFRVIFNTYFGTELSLLEDRSYLMSWQQPSSIKDITGIRDTLDSCTVSDD